jgi:hypothetical protein
MSSDSTQEVVGSIFQDNLKPRNSDEDPSALAAAFACAVTVAAEPHSLVARNGELSIFSAYQRIYPEVRFQHQAFDQVLDE